MTALDERRTKRKPRLKWYIAGSAAGIISLPLLMYICAVLLAKDILPFELMEELVITCVFLAGTAGGIAACAGRGEKVMQTGAAAGCILAAVIIVAALAVPGMGPLNASSLKHIIAAVCGGAFGGALCIKRKKPGKGRKKRR